MLAAVAASCGAPRSSVRPPAPPADEPSSAALDDEAVAAIADLLRAEDRRSLDTARLAWSLDHPLPEVRERAALAAGRIGDLRANTFLLRALDDSARAVAAAAAFALGELGDTSATTLYALAGKLGMSWAGDDERGVEAVAALGKLGTPGAYAVLRQELQRYVRDDDGNEVSSTTAAPMGAVGKEALLAIWKFPRLEAAVDLVAPHLEAHDEDVRWRAAYVFSRVPSQRVVASLRSRLSDPSPLVRSFAARALRASTVDSAGQRAETTAALSAVLADPHPHVRINAAGALATYADSALAPALDGVLVEDDANVRIAATSALAALGGGPALDRLAAIEGDTMRPLVERHAALTGMIRLDTTRGIAEAERWASSDDWLTRLYAARALTDASWNDAARLLVSLVEDHDSRVAVAAMRTIELVTDSVSAPYTLYFQALASNEIAVRARAAIGLSRRRSAADLSALMQAYERAQSDSSNEAVLAAVDALAELQRQGVPVDRAFFLRFERSADAVVRRRVVQHFGARAWGDEPESDPLAHRDAAFYERIVRDLVVPDLTEGHRPSAVIQTAAGTIVFELVAAHAPLTAHNFITLATESGYFPTPDDAQPPRLRWHRVVPNFVLQDGDPRGDGGGGPGYSIRDEINRLRFDRGSVGMALSGRDTGGSQYFITHSPQPHLDGGFTLFGRVISGMDVADRVVQDDPIHSIRITR